MPVADATSLRRRSGSSTKTHAIRLLLVDDHEVVRVGLRTVLHNNQGITIVGEADSKAQAARRRRRETLSWSGVCSRSRPIPT